MTATPTKEVTTAELASRIRAMDDSERVECLLRNYKHVELNLGLPGLAALAEEAMELGISVPKGMQALLRPRRPKRPEVKVNPLPEGAEIWCWLPACPPWLMQPSTPEQVKQEPEVIRRLTLAERMERAARRLPK